MPIHPTRQISALAVLASVVASSPISARAPEPAHASNSRDSNQVITIGGNKYRFPKYAIVRYFGKPVPHAVEVNLRKPFWAAIFDKVAPSPAWMTFDNGGIGLHYITKPNDLFQWRLDRPAPLPPVRGPVEALAAEDGMRVWKSADPQIAEERVYITFDGRADLYGQCREKDLRSPARSCEIWMFDRGVIHPLHVAGTWIKHAPASADAYLRTVRVEETAMNAQSGPPF